LKDNIRDNQQKEEPEGQPGSGHEKDPGHTRYRNAMQGSEEDEIPGIKKNCDHGDGNGAGAQQGKTLPHKVPLNAVSVDQGKSHANTDEKKKDDEPRKIDPVGTGYKSGKDEPEMVQVKDQVVNDHQAHGHTANKVEHGIALPLNSLSVALIHRGHFISDRAHIFISSFSSDFPKSGYHYIGISSLTDKNILFTMHSVFQGPGEGRRQ
jgi:hypothetical protein